MNRKGGVRWKRFSLWLRLPYSIFSGGSASKRADVTNDVARGGDSSRNVNVVVAVEADSRARMVERITAARRLAGSGLFVTGERVRVKYSHECDACPDRGEPYCRECDEHYGDCSCPGPAAEIDDGWLVVVEDGDEWAYPVQTREKGGGQGADVEPR